MDLSLETIHRRSAEKGIEIQQRDVMVNSAGVTLVQSAPRKGMRADSRETASSERDGGILTIETNPPRPKSSEKSKDHFDLKRRESSA
jgi:hypothetical protein